MEDFAKFPAWKEWMTTVLSKFNDTPESYRAWESLQGLGLIVESTVFKRLYSFPHLSVRDSVKLRELRYILLEFLADKMEGHLPGLNYLDTTHGIKPKVELL